SAPFLPKADVVLVIESTVPWIPKTVTPKRDAKIVHISTDPLAQRYPFREVEADLLITGHAADALVSLRAALRDAMKGKQSGIDSRRKMAAAAREDNEAKRLKVLETARNAMPIHSAWLAACVNQIKAEDAIVVSELGVPIAHLDLTQHGTYMG